MLDRPPSSGNDVHAQGTTRPSPEGLHGPGLRSRSPHRDNPARHRAAPVCRGSVTARPRHSRGRNRSRHFPRSRFQSLFRGSLPATTLSDPARTAGYRVPFGRVSLPLILISPSPYLSQSMSFSRHAAPISHNSRRPCPHNPSSTRVRGPCGGNPSPCPCFPLHCVNPIVFPPPPPGHPGFRTQGLSSGGISRRDRLIKPRYLLWVIGYG